MNALRNLFSSRTLNYLRQNGQNALINATQQQPGNVGEANTPLTASDTDANDVRSGPISIPRSILDACQFTAKFDLGRLSTSAAVVGRPPGSLSPTTLKRLRRMQRKMELVYRCKLCNTRNTKIISEEAYYSGVVILQCDGCAVDHLIKDNLGLFSSNSRDSSGSSTSTKNLEQLLSERTKNVRVIKVNEQGELI